MMPVVQLLAQDSYQVAATGQGFTCTQVTHRANSKYSAKWELLCLLSAVCIEPHAGKP